MMIGARNANVEGLRREKSVAMRKKDACYLSAFSLLPRQEAVEKAQNEAAVPLEKRAH